KAKSQAAIGGCVSEPSPPRAEHNLRRRLGDDFSSRALLPHHERGLSIARAKGSREMAVTMKPRSSAKRVMSSNSGTTSSAVASLSFNAYWCRGRPSTALNVLADTGPQTVSRGQETTHVSGIIRYLCDRNGQSADGSRAGFEIGRKL